LITLNFAAFVFSFIVLFKCASFFVEGASELARVLNIPKMVVGIVLVGLATTAPEFGVSVVAASLGHPEIALGNAIGSVICDDGIALALAALLAPAVILVNCRLLKIVGVFLLSIDFLAYFLAKNGVIGRAEGVLLVLILGIYYVILLKNRRYGFGEEKQEAAADKNSEKSYSQKRSSKMKRPIQLFVFGLAGVVACSYVIVWAAERIALHFSISETLIGLTIIAIGTSLPEISTCITAALKGEGEIAVGNIIGADILNVLWIIGVSSVVNPIKVDLSVINFTFPYMILIVTAMLASMRLGCRLGKGKGVLLIVMYLIYLFLVLKLFL
jgi:cation:H+ antiporter